MTDAELRERTHQVRVFAFDLDGTAFCGFGVMSDRTRAALGALMGRGVVVLPASGRGFVGLFDGVLHMGGFPYAITGNGSIVVDGATGEHLSVDLIDPSDGAAVIERLMLPETCLYVHWGDTSRPRAYCYVGGEAWAKRWRELGRPVPAAEDTVPDLAAVVRKHDAGISKIGVLFEGDAMASRVCSIARGSHGVDGFAVGPWSAEVVAEGVSKGAALTTLAGRLGVPMAQVCAIGDSGNDVSMIRAAGLGVAMGNASADVRAVADATVGPNTDDGMAAFIEGYLL